MIGKTNASSGGGQQINKSVVIITAPTGSKVTLTDGGKTKTAPEKNGTWTFTNIENGEWIAKATLGLESTEILFTIDKPNFWRIGLTFSDIPEFTYTGECEVVQDDGTLIQKENYKSYRGHYKIIFKTRGLLTFLSAGNTRGFIDVFLVGGGGDGGGGSKDHGSGGAGGYTKTVLHHEIQFGVPIKVEIGAGGNPGGTTKFNELECPGGMAGSFEKNKYKPTPDGGSGGGGAYADGGSNGQDGKQTYDSCPSGKGQISQAKGKNTKEFGEPNGKLYSGGGGGSTSTDGEWTNGGEGGGGKGNVSHPKPGKENTGGGGGGTWEFSGAPGGSGIAIIRDSREVA